MIKRYSKHVLLMWSIAIMMLTLFSLTSFADSEELSILSVSSGDDKILIEVKNNLDVATVFTMTIVKNENNAGELLFAPQYIYGAQEETIGANETMFFDVGIPSNKDGEIGKGKYRILLQNSNKERVEKTVAYVSPTDVDAYVEALETIVSDPDKTYLDLADMMTEDYEGELMGLGIALDTFENESGEVQEGILDFLYKLVENTPNITKTEIISQYPSMYALSVYNNISPSRGIEILSLKYNAQPLDENILVNAIELMPLSYEYDQVSILKSDFTDAYGIATINKAHFSGMGNALQVFKATTGKCINEIAAIQGLSNSNQYIAYEYMVNKIKADTLNTIDELKELLKNAHAEATKNNGSSTGGGSSGSSGNRKPTVATPSGLNATGSTTFPSLPNNEYEEKIIFEDLTIEHWAAKSVDFLKRKGVVTGNENGMFEPNRKVTREEFAKMLVLAFELEEKSINNIFGDMKNDEWYCKYVETATAHGIVKGISEDMFGIGINISRQDMAVMTDRAIKIKNLQCEYIREDAAFADEEKIADYAVDSIRSLYKAGIINGKGEGLFDPYEGATRAEAAMIIYGVVGGND